jgi:hypothetical protein
MAQTSASQIDLLEVSQYRSRLWKDKQSLLLRT